MRRGYFSFMFKKIVISSFNNTGAIVQNNKVQQFFSINSNYQVNDIYLGSIHRIYSSINAAFINLGRNKKSGFIHFNDLKYLKKTYKSANIADILSMDQLVMVQVIKEPTLSKGPRLTSNINLFGRYLVLMPLCNTINISSKIYDENEKSYLYSLAVLLKPSSMGLLVRSSAVGTKVQVLVEELRFLKRQWCFIQKLAIFSKSPCLLYKDEDLVKKIVRDLYNSKVNSIITDSSKILNRVRYYLNSWDCLSFSRTQDLNLLKQSHSILDKFQMQSTIANALKPKVALSMGAYLFIEAYEALTIIDVNSGSFNQANNSQETVLKTNCYAATEIAYQMQMRNINGIIIIDFIDMESYRDQLQLLEHFARVLSMDNAKPQIIQMSQLGLVELTRRRREQSLLELFYYQVKKNEDQSEICGINNLLIKHKGEITKNDLIHQNINHLFFGIFFIDSIDLSSWISNRNNNCKKIDYKYLKDAKLNYIFVVPSILYSQIIDLFF